MLSLIGSLACQRNSYLKSLTTTVVSCKPSNSKKQFEVTLTDTCFFPEGGGQLSDVGTITILDSAIPDIKGVAAQVTYVQRQGLQCIHLCDRNIPVGASVQLEIDWKRRWRHMQTHSGQHLISSVLEKEFNYKTVSWKMGDLVSYIELENLPSLSGEFLQSAEARLNQIICENRQIKVTSVLPSSTESSSEKETTTFENRQDFRENKLPDDVDGAAVRYVELEGLEVSPCCGTHVSSTGQIQMIKLLQTERIRGKNLRLFFVIGDRFLEYSQGQFDRERQMTGVLQCEATEHVPKATKLLEDAKQLKKNLKTLQKEHVELLGKNWIGQLQLNGEGSSPELFVYYRESAELEFLNAITHHVNEFFVEAKRVLLVAGGNEEKGGPCIIIGPSENISQTIPKFLSAIPTVKGGGKGGRWQGKATSWIHIKNLGQTFPSVIFL